MVTQSGPIYSSSEMARLPISANPVLEYTEDMRQESLKSLSVFYIMQYLQETKEPRNQQSTSWSTTMAGD